MRPQLIVNGDDLGRTATLTRGIEEAHERGILTAASIVAGGPDFEGGVAAAKRQPELAVGVHLVLDEYAPVAPPDRIPSLLDGGGAFPARPVALLRTLFGLARREEIRREWEAQIQRVVDAGLRPSHLDGHGHCHASPTLAALVVELAHRFQIPAVRLPAESLRYPGAQPRFSLPRYLAKALLVGASLPARIHWRGRLRCADRFFGFMDGGRLNVQALERIARGLRPGVSELMTHPATDNTDEPFGLDYDWRGDLDTLLAWSRAEFEERFGVQLVSYRDAA